MHYHLLNFKTSKHLILFHVTSFHEHFVTQHEKQVSLAGSSGFAERRQTRTLQVQFRLIPTRGDSRVDRNRTNTKEVPLRLYSLSVKLTVL